jgi:D-alanyl-D-alanine carboxypeptidase/D-alanyl-D-alanine-endopeptidase (penicillin-binding protein 4)
MRSIFYYLNVSLILFLLASCGMPAQIQRTANRQIISHPSLQPAHVGISVADAATGEHLFNHQADKYFVPASNTKLFTCMAALQTLGDSLLTFRWVDKGNGTIEVEANGDPTFLHPDYKQQPAFEWLRQQQRILITDQHWKDNGMGAGWAWDDYSSDYMAERSFLPLYGNLANFQLQKGILNSIPPRYERLLQPSVNSYGARFNITRPAGVDSFYLVPSVRNFSGASIPFHVTGAVQLAGMLADTLRQKVEYANFKLERRPDVKLQYSQPTDSVLAVMMHRSDNFFAEQLLLMTSNEKLGFMNTRRIIDTLLNNEWKDIPQRPKWVDGSGLSRYNLFTPNDFVWLLQRMKDKYDWQRISHILPTGDEGTLKGLYKNYAGKIYAKTGTLSNHVALSGFLLTQKGRTLIFSILVNAHQTSAGEIRKQIETFLTGIIDRY